MTTPIDPSAKTVISVPENPTREVVQSLFKTAQCQKARLESEQKHPYIVIPTGRDGREVSYKEIVGSGNYSQLASFNVQRFAECFDDALLPSLKKAAICISAQERLNPEATYTMVTVTTEDGGTLYQVHKNTDQ